MTTAAAGRATGTVTVSATDIMRLLPHRHPFALLDGVRNVIPGVSGTGIKHVSISDPVFAGHFPGHPVYPGVLMVEAAAQVGGIILAVAAREPGSADSISGDLGAPPELVGVLAAVRRFQFKRIVMPGDSLLIAARIGARVGGLVEVSAELRVENTLVAAGSVAIAVSRSGPVP